VEHAFTAINLVDLTDWVKSADVFSDYGESYNSRIPT